MRLQLTGPRHTRRILVAASLALGLLSHPEIGGAATKATAAKKRAAEKKLAAEKKAAEKKAAEKKAAEKKQAAEKKRAADEKEASRSGKRGAGKKAGVQPEEVTLDEEAGAASEDSEPETEVESAQDGAGSKAEASEAREPAAKVEPVAGPALRASVESTAYTDSDAVNVLTSSLTASASDEVTGWSVGGSYLVDVVTAASVDIVSTASPSWTEIRHVGALNGSLKWDPFSFGAVGVVSREPDYLAITGGGSLSFDLMEKNVTPYFALSFERDSIGRTDLPHEFWQDKQVTNLQAGVTLVLGRADIGSVQWDSSFERGYLAKPYRYVPLFTPGQGASIPAGASIAEVNRLRLGLRAVERLPGSRDRHALSAHYAHRFSRSTLRLDERLYADDWKLLAATTDARYILDVGERLQLWLHLRHHIQNSVSFWKRAYEALPSPDGLVAPSLRTGDRELGPLQTLLLGVGTRWTLAGDANSHWDLVFEVDVGRTTFTDTLYITERRIGFSTLALEALF